MSSAKNLLTRVSSLLFIVQVSHAQSGSFQQPVNQHDSTDLSLLLPSEFYQAAATEIISGNSLELLSTAPVGHIIQGQASGVWSFQTSAQPAGLTSLWIRGYNSSTANNQPLIVLDGVPLYANTPFSEDAQVGPLSLLNPYDIASVEILKDGSAARYGMRGFNGVIVINSKKGKEGKFNVTIDNKVGFQRYSKLLDLMNAQQYAGFVNEFYAELDSVVFSGAQIDALGEGTNWQKELYTIAPVWQNHASVSGGSTKNQYHLSGSHLTQRGIVQSSNFRRYTLSASSTHYLTQRLSVTPRVNYARASSKLAPDQVINHALSFSPTQPVKDSLGNYQVNGPVGYGFQENPIELIDRVKSINQSSQLFGKVNAAYQLWDSLVVAVDFGINSFENSYAYTPEKDFQSFSRERRHQGFTRLIEPSISYQRRWATHDLGTTLGLAFQKEEQRTNDVVWNLEEERLNSISESRRVWKYNTPLWADIFYRFDRRYQLSLSGRFENYKYLVDSRAFSPFVAVAWHLHQERFVKRWAKQSEITFRASYGSVKKTYPAYFSTTNGWVTLFETNRQWNLAVDASALQKRIEFSLDVYQKNVSSPLSVAVSSPTGYDRIFFLSEIEVLNRGLEFKLATHHTIGNIIWQSRLSVSGVKSWVLSLPDDIKRHTFSARLPLVSFISDEGETPGSFLGYTDSGIFMSENEVEESGQAGTSVGDLKFADVSGGKGKPDGIFNADDATAIGNAQPSWMLGLNQYVGYRSWTIEALLYASIGNETLHYQKYIQQSGWPFSNQYERVLDRWSPERPESTIPATLRSNEISQYGVEGASFLRLRDITVSYQFQWSKQKLNTKLYLSAQNLFTITAYQGYDPEVSHFGQNSNTLGVDYDSYPRAKTYLLG